jgi:hypothetical protein
LWALLWAVTDATLLEFGVEEADLHLDEHRVVLVPSIAQLAAGHRLAWSRQRPRAGTYEEKSFQGQLEKGGTELSISSLLSDYPGCGGLSRLDLAAGSKDRPLIATTCEEGGTRLVHVGFDGGDLMGLFPRPDRADHVPHLVEAVGGGYWVVWGTGDVYTTASDQVLAARLGADGRLRGDLIEVTAQDEALIGWSQEHLDVAPLANGGFVAAYFALPQDGGRAVRLRFYGEEGELTAGPIDVPPPQSVLSIRLSVAPSDRTSVVWDGLEDGWRRVYAASFTADGEPLAPPREVGVPVAPDRDFALPRISHSSRGAVIAWLERASSGEDWIAARKWSPVLGPVGLVTRVPASVARTWPFLELALVEAPDGGLRVYWSPAGRDGLNEPARIRWRELTVAPDPPPAPPAPAAARPPGRP